MGSGFWEEDNRICRRNRKGPRLGYVDRFVEGGGLKSRKDCFRGCLILEKESQV